MTLIGEVSVLVTTGVLVAGFTPFLQWRSKKKKQKAIAIYIENEAVNRSMLLNYFWGADSDIVKKMSVFKFRSHIDECRYPTAAELDYIINPLVEQQKQYPSWFHKAIKEYGLEKK